MERKGICKNVGVCTMVDKVQVIADDDAEFVCAECGEKLEPCKEKDSVDGIDNELKSKKRKRLILFCIVALLLLGGIGFGIFMLLKKPSAPTVIKLDKSEVTMKVGETAEITPMVEPEGVKATFVFKVSKDSKIVSVSDKGMITALDSGETKVFVKCIENPALKAVCKIRVNAIVSLAKDSTETSKEKSKEGSKEESKAETKKTEPKSVNVPSRDNSYGTSNLGYGVYEGPKENGKPSGMGGQIRFTRSYTIDLKKASGETVDVNPGDVMINVKMKDGRLIQGQLKRTDGSQRWIIIG